MALLSFAGAPHGGRQRHLPEWQSQPKITPTTIISHSIVGSAEGAWQMFATRSVLESHFIVDLDGAIWQLMDTDRQADANLRANAFAISIETADRGDPDNQPWTLAQLQSLIWLHEAIVTAHPTIPRRRCPTSAGGGLGYHTLFGAPSDWTPVSKTCPGRVRKAQWLATLLPAFLNPPKEDPDMAFTDAQAKLLADTAKTVEQIRSVLFDGHERQNIPIDNLYGHALRVHDAMVVPGTTNAEDAFNLLFARVRNIEAAVEAIALWLGGTEEPPVQP